MISTDIVYGTGTAFRAAARPREYSSKRQKIFAFLFFPLIAIWGGDTHIYVGVKWCRCPHNRCARRGGLPFAYIPLPFRVGANESRPWHHHWKPGDGVQIETERTQKMRQQYAEKDTHTRERHDQ